MALLNRLQVIERLKAGEKMHEEGNTMMFKNGDFCTAATDIYLRDNGLVKITGGLNKVYSWRYQEKVK